MAADGNLVYGVHAVDAILARRPGDILGAVILSGKLSGRLAELVARLEAARVPIERGSRARLDELANGGVHQGVVIRLPAPRVRDVDWLERLLAEKGDDVRLLVLDQVEDPRNLGACLRTADAVAVDAVIIPKARSAKLSAGALKAAAGAAEVVPLVVVANLARALRSLGDAGVRLVGLDERATQTVFEAEIASPVAVVLGAEGRGLRRLTREACDQLIRIPMHGTVASLNVSVAASVVLYELLRQSL